MASTQDSAVLLGAEIRRLRQGRGWTLRHLAALVDLDFGYIGKIERGENATLETYQEIAMALGVSLSVLAAVLDGRKRPRAA